MRTCKMCGAGLTDDDEIERHNETMHPNMGKKGGMPSDGMPSDERKPDRDRPID